MEELVEQAIIWWRPSSGRPVNGHLETLVVWNRCGATPFFERQKRELCVGCPVGHLNCTDRVGSSDHLNCFGEDALDQLMLVKTCWSFIDHQSLRSVKSAVVAAKTHTIRAMTAQIAAGDTPSPAAPPRHISPSQMKGGGSTTKKAKLPSPGFEHNMHCLGKLFRHIPMNSLKLVKIDDIPACTTECAKMKKNTSDGTTMSTLCMLAYKN
uniref:Uncharacterized protein n=1 Tax=Globodera rostochiensis TaxID=31243 RepID=A0A914HU35_GLORO